MAISTRTCSTPFHGRPAAGMGLELYERFGERLRLVGAGVAVGDKPFLDYVPLRVAVADAEGHYHLPLICTPWTYSTYRGS
jgi:5-hydroxyisourate hydrolase-like protein (transthyretin family)